ncbi:hypothetical protein Trydic_g22047 [Trypoxylus dichotomus]
MGYTIESAAFRFQFAPPFWSQLPSRHPPKTPPLPLPSVQCRVTPSNAFDVHVYGGPFMHVTKVTCSSRPVIDDSGQEVACACR